MNKLIKTYLGFSIKSRAIVIGQDRIKVYKDKIHLIVYCPTATQNLKDLIGRMSEKFKCSAVLMDEKLEDYTGIEGCKVLGLTNKSLADAIIKITDNDN